MEKIIKQIFNDEDFISNGESFLSEKDLQFNLARMLQTRFKHVLLEYPTDNKYIDIYCKNNKQNKADKTEYFVEIKYKTKYCININRFGLNGLVLHDHKAYYDNRFYVYCDIAGLENIVLKNKNYQGYVLFLTNDEKYQSNKNKKYPLHNIIKKGKYEHRSIKNKKGKYEQSTKKIISIANDYNFEWQKFNDQFQYMLIKIQNKTK